MGKSVFQAGVEVEINGKTYCLLRKVGDALWQLEQSRDKRISEYSDTDLRNLYVKGELVFAGGMADRLKPQEPGKPHRAISDAQWATAKMRRTYVLAVLGHPNTHHKLEPLVQKAWESSGNQDMRPSIATVMRWRRKYVHAGHDIVSLVERTAKRGNRTNRYPDEVIEFAQSAIDMVYLTLERKTVQAVVTAARVLVDQENALRPASLHLPHPTIRLIQRLIAEIPAYDRCVARHGRLIANKRFRSVLSNRITQAPLERAEIDHTILDLMVIDDDSRLPLGRPYVTVCIDDYSRCILGIYIGFEPPSYLTAAHCLKHAFRPKTDLKERYPRIQGEWLAHGVMAILVVDNGPEFHSVSLENACYSMGIELHYSARKTPWYKGKIERFMGTLNRDIAHGAPGTTFSNIFDKEEYDPLKHAIVRLSVLREIIHLWIVDVYHERVHRTLKAPPVAIWKSSITADDIYLPDDPAHLDAIMGRSEKRRLTHKGIELDGLFYNSPELTTLRRQLGDVLDVEIRVDDANIGSIFVLSPNKERIFKVPAVNFAYANGMTAWQHKVCKRYAARQMERYEVQGWMAAKQVISDLIAAEFGHKKHTTRATIARFQGDANPLAATPHIAPVLPVSAPSVVEPPPCKVSAEPLTPEDLSLPTYMVTPPKRFQPVIRNRAPTMGADASHGPSTAQESRHA